MEQPLNASNSTVHDCVTALRNLEISFLISAVSACCVVIIILAYLTNRKSCFPKVCNGRPGLILPVNLLDGFENRWSFAVAFGASTGMVMSLMIERLTKKTTYHIDNPLQYVFTILFLIFLAAFILYPLFACLSTPHKLVGSVLGSLYTIIWCVFQTLATITCQDHVKQLLPPISKFVIQLPVLICMYLLAFKYLYTLVYILRSKMYRNGQEPLAYNHHKKYVKYLMKTPQNPPKTFFKRHFYNWRDDFQFTTRMLSTIVVSAIMLYIIEAEFVILANPVFKVLERIETYNIPGLDTVILSLKVAWFISFAVTTVGTVLNCLHFLKCHRSNVLMMYRGSKLFLPAISKAKDEIGHEMRYSGYQVSHALWGVLMMHLSVLIGSWIILYFIINAIRDPDQLKSFLISMTPFMIITLLTLILLHVSKRFFLQDKINDHDLEKPLAVKNRYAYHNVNYLAFYQIVVLGLISSLLRLVKVWVFGLVMLGRLDVTLLKMGAQRFDAGYLSYVGMLHTEHAHNHPVLRVFCQLLMDSINEKRSNELLKRGVSKQRPRLRWLVAYTHLRNHSLLATGKCMPDREPCKLTMSHSSSDQV